MWRWKDFQNKAVRQFITVRNFCLTKKSFSEIDTKTPGPILIKQQQFCYSLNYLSASAMALLNLGKLRWLKK